MYMHTEKFNNFIMLIIAYPILYVLVYLNLINTHLNVSKDNRKPWIIGTEGVFKIYYIIYVYITLKASLAPSFSFKKYA